MGDALGFILDVLMELFPGATIVVGLMLLLLLVGVPILLFKALGFVRDAVLDIVRCFIAARTQRR